MVVVVDLGVVRLLVWAYEAETVDGACLEEVFQGAHIGGREVGANYPF